MRRNEARRQHLLDAAIALLAQEGGRGLSYRTLDAAAELPTGTSSNYFRDRNDLLQQIAAHSHLRLQPDQAWIEQSLTDYRGPELLHVLLMGMVQRVMGDPLAFRALLELRLEAVRRPTLHQSLSGIFDFHFLENQEFTSRLGFRIEQAEFALLYVAMNGLLIELLTTPNAFKDSPDELVRMLVTRFLPAAH